jgi:hypothetical protein
MTQKAHAANPPLPIRAQHGGAKWRGFYRALSPHEQSRVVMRMVLGRLRYFARKRGEPLPTVFTYEPELAPGGGMRAREGTLRPMTNEEINEILPWP